MADDEEDTPQRRALVRVIRIGTTVAGALALVAAAWLALNGYESAGLVGAFPGLVLFVFAIFLLQVAAYTPREPPPPNP